jgi:hypothetical protein
MAKRVNLGDASTWATRVVDEAKTFVTKVETSINAARAEALQSSSNKKGKTRSVRETYVNKPLLGSLFTAINSKIPA